MTPAKKAPAKADAVEADPLADEDTVVLVGPSGSRVTVAKGDQDRFDVLAAYGFELAK